MNKLTVARHDEVSIWDWYLEYEAGRLDLSPSFQRRGNLWSKYKKAHLIDSVINGFDIPKIYVADFTFGPSSLNEKRRPYAVVDGRQRFEAFFQFLRNEYPLNKSAIFEDDPSLKISGLNYSELKVGFPELARKIEDFSPTVMSIITNDKGKIAEMFVRLNSGEAANGAERRNAKPGLVPDLLREMTSHPFFANRVRFNTARMAEFNLAAKLLMLEHKQTFVDTKAANLDRFVIDAARETGAFVEGEPNEDEVREFGLAKSAYEKSFASCLVVLEDMAAIFEPKDPLLASAGHIPVYYKIVQRYPQVADNFRDFLLNFTAAVDNSRENSRNGGKVDDELLVYYTYGRTTNDQRSLRERFRIMESRLRKKKLI
ncbi:DUF262 domain-containing protein [Xanthomonas campestris]|uniref:DUF262 domain-containing protein n=1 Tax=Xanthomonas campestris TaxID=339 RepID=UPI003CECAA4F